jgi:hypothetical protein
VVDTEAVETLAKVGPEVQAEVLREGLQAVVVLEHLAKEIQVEHLLVLL